MYLIKWLKSTETEEGNRYPGTGNTENPEQDEPRFTPRHIIIKTAEVKRILKAAREKQRGMYKGKQGCLFIVTVFFLKGQPGGGMTYLKCWKGKNLQPRILYIARLSFWTKGGKNNFSDKEKLRAS